jgi:hypothetical protein
MKLFGVGRAPPRLGSSLCDPPPPGYIAFAPYSEISHTASGDLTSSLFCRPCGLCCGAACRLQPGPPPAASAQQLRLSQPCG